MLSKELNANDKYKNKIKVLGRKEELEITVGASFDGDTQPLLVWPIYEFFRGIRGRGASTLRNKKCFIFTYIYMYK